MRYKHIMTYFWIALPLCVLLRTLQSFFTVDQNGFALKFYSVYNVALTALTVIGIAVAGILGLMVHRCPPKAPSRSKPLGVISVIYGMGLIALTCLPDNLSFAAVWQYIAYIILGFFTGVLFIVFGVRMFVKFKFPKIFFMAPVLFEIIKLITMFVSISTLALTIRNVFLLASNCFALIFMLEFAKLVNGIEEDSNFKKLLSSGITSVLLSAVVSVPSIISLLAGRASRVSSIIWICFLDGALILSFILAHFSAKNLKRSHRRHHHSTKKGGNTQVDAFYIGNRHKKAENK